MAIPLKLIIAILLGAAIGFERESYEHKIDKTSRSGIGGLGVRSYSLITLLGAIAGLTLVSYPLLFIFISGIFGGLVFIYYILGSIHTKDVGMTTELAILTGYVIGVLMGFDFLPVQLVVALSVILILILSLKDEIKSFVAGVKEFEFDAFISYAIIALVILPFLPDVSYTISSIPGIKEITGASLGPLGKIELINPFNLWKVVAIITGIEVFGYFLEKTIGQKGGWLLTSIAGGFISSTSTTQSLAIKSKTVKTTHRLVAAALFANIASFIQHFLLIASINAILLVKAVPFIASILVSAILIALYFVTRKDRITEKQIRETKKNLKKDSIFSLKPALQFAVIFLVIKFVSKASLIVFGQNAFFVTVVFSSLAGIDAITMNISEMAGKIITWKSAVIALMLANGVNLLAKSVYSFVLGSRSFAWHFFLSVFVIILFGCIGLLF